jgi:hypothetical protein
MLQEITRVYHQRLGKTLLSFTVIGPRKAIMIGGSSSDVLNSYKDQKISMKTDNNPTWIIKYFHDPFAVNIKALPCKHFGEREFRTVF